MRTRATRATYAGVGARQTGALMDRFSLIVVSDETSPVRRFEIRKTTVRRGLWAAGVAALVGLGVAVDYVRVRIDNRELDALRKRDQRAARAGGGVPAEARGRRSQARAAPGVRAQDPHHRESAGLGGDRRRGGDGGRLRARRRRGDARRRGRSARIRSPSSPAATRRSRACRARPRTPTWAERVSLLREAAETLGVVAEGQSASLGDLVQRARGQARVPRVVAVDLAGQGLAHLALRLPRLAVHGQAAVPRRARHRRRDRAPT